MNKIKTLTLSLSEITDILQITDPVVREAAVKALNIAAENPEAIDLEQYQDSPRVVRTLVEKVHRKARNARKRAEARAKKKSLFSYKKAINVRVDDKVAKRLLWIKQNLPVAVDAVTRALAGCEGEESAVALSAAVTEIFESVTDYLRPLTEGAKRYFHLPKYARPSHVALR